MKHNHTTAEDISIHAAIVTDRPLGVINMDGRRPTQPPTLCGEGNEYQPKCGDALRLGSKSSMAHSRINVRVAGNKLCDPYSTRAILLLSALEEVIKLSRKGAIQMSCLQLLLLELQLLKNPASK